MTSIDSGDSLYGVGCSSVTQCTAVDGDGREVTFDPMAPGSPTPTGIPGAKELLGVDCRSASACVAVDETGDGFVGNAPPICQPVQATAAENVAAQVSFSCSSAWVPSTYAVVSNPSHGTLSGLDAANGTVTYTPNAAYSGPDGFTYQATNSNGASNAATVAITVADTTAPSVSITTPANGATYVLGQVVNAGYRAPTPTVRRMWPAAPGRWPRAARSIPRASAPTRSRCSAADRAGNTVSQTVQYTVAVAGHVGSPTPTVKTSGRSSTKRHGATVPWTQASGSPARAAAVPAPRPRPQPCG